MDDLDRLRTALAALDDASLLDQARALPGLIDQARGLAEALSARRGAVLAELTAPGAEYYRRIPALAEAIPCHRSRIDEALGARRKAAAS